MKICPHCGFKDSPFWKPLFWKLYWEYMDLRDFLREYPTLVEPCNKALVSRMRAKIKSKIGNFWYHFEDEHYYYKISGKTRLMIHRFPKGYESMANRKLFEKTPSEKGQDDVFQKKLIER